jgi:hypothetical protein
LVEKELFIESINKICSVVSPKNQKFWKKLIGQSKNKAKSNRFKKLKIWIFGIFVAVNLFMKIFFGVGVENSNQQFISDSYKRKEDISIVHYHPYPGFLWNDSYKPLKTLTSVYDNPNQGNVFERNLFLSQHVTNQLRSGADKDEYIPLKIEDDDPLIASLRNKSPDALDLDEFEKRGRKSINKLLAVGFEFIEPVITDTRF